MNTVRYENENTPSRSISDLRRLRLQQEDAIKIGSTPRQCDNR